MRPAGAGIDLDTFVSVLCSDGTRGVNSPAAHFFAAVRPIVRRVGIDNVWCTTHHTTTIRARTPLTHFHVRKQQLRSISVRRPAVANHNALFICVHSTHTCGWRRPECHKEDSQHIAPMHHHTHTHTHKRRIAWVQLYILIMPKTGWAWYSCMADASSFGVHSAGCCRMCAACFALPRPRRTQRNRIIIIEVQPDNWLKVKHSGSPRYVKNINTNLKHSPVVAVAVVVVVVVVVVVFVAVAAVAVVAVVVDETPPRRCCLSRAGSV